MANAAPHRTPGTGIYLWGPGTIMHSRKLRTSTIEAAQRHTDPEVPICGVPLRHRPGHRGHCIPADEMHHHWQAGASRGEERKPLEIADATSLGDCQLNPRGLCWHQWTETLTCPGCVTLLEVESQMSDLIVLLTNYLSPTGPVHYPNMAARMHLALPSQQRQ
ncbi:hypothetical protein CcaCcLH18_10641 [Colletotrichum camelliae]|nr:hypothetical protein CcaCcLH18_10641 [Colletotrichum camelliae]